VPDGGYSGDRHCARFRLAISPGSWRARVAILIVSWTAFPAPRGFGPRRIADRRKIRWLAGRGDGGSGHLYEHGHATRCGVALETLKALGVGSVILTNAGGSLREEFPPGSVIAHHRDHINFSGTNPADRRGERRPLRRYERGLRCVSQGARRSPPRTRKGSSCIRGVYMGSPVRPLRRRRDPARRARSAPTPSDVDRAGGDPGALPRLEGARFRVT